MRILDSVAALQSSPPKLGGVAAPFRKRSRSETAQTGWFQKTGEPPRPRQQRRLRDIS